MSRWSQSFPYFLKEAILHMRESRAVTVLTVLTTTIGLLFIGALWIVHVNVAHLIKNWRERFQIEIYFTDNATPIQKEAVRKVLFRTRAVERIAERSATQALESFRSQLGPDADVLNGLGQSILPSSYRVVLHSGWRTVENVELLMNQVRVMPGVERLRNDLAWLRRLDSVIHLLRLSVWTVSILLGLGVLFIIANTIRMTLYARRDDITVMHIVGATDGFIRTPFITEGMLCGFFGGIFAYLILLLVHHAFFLPMLAIYTNGTFLVQPVGWFLGLLLVGTGACLGLAGSAMTVSHYLRKQRE